MAELDVTFLDVGQGDGTWIACPDGTKILVDLGSKKNGEIAGSGAIEYIRQQLAGSTVINYLFLTHGDGDHYNLLPELYVAIPGLTITNVCIGGLRNDYSQWVKDNVFTPATTFTEFADCDKDAIDSPRWTFGDVKIYLLSANVPTKEAGYKNEKSLVLMVEYAGRKLVLTGDAEMQSEDKIVNTNYNSVAGQAFLKSFALKLGHHGSENATTDFWLNALQAGAYFASGDQKWGHPYCSVYVRIINARFVRVVPEFKHGYVCGEYLPVEKDYNWININNLFYIFSNLYVVTLSPPVTILPAVDDGEDIGMVPNVEPGWAASGSHYGYAVKDNGEIMISHSENLEGNPPNTGWFTP
ncbi:MAG: beta-lactamase [Bacteroidetes bacterium]|nr:MAG: beta-lactamase [Bacteroidota bacterium]